MPSLVWMASTPAMRPKFSSVIESPSSENVSVSLPNPPTIELTVRTFLFRSLKVSSPPPPKSVAPLVAVVFALARASRVMPTV